MTWVTKSDAFRDIYDERRRQKNLAVHEALSGTLAKVAQQSLDILSDRLDKNPAGIATSAVLEVADKALERLGYGVKLPGTVIDARSQNITLSSEDFALAQSVVRGLENEHSARSAVVPIDPLRPIRGTVAPPMNPLPKPAPPSSARSVRDILDAHGFAVGISNDDSDDEE